MRIGTREVVHISHSYVAEYVQAGIQMGRLSGSVTAPFPTRRREERVAEQRVCTYELCEAIDEAGVTIQQGEAYSLNRSSHGILLFMGAVPRKQQLLEIHVPESNWRRSLNLYEVKWTKPVTVDSRNHLFLVGCRLMFGPSRYWAF
ncbi:MAG: hypothetical protein HP494_14870 [Nitrospira sp.]|nr:hypothetical protein [Nitrospira sp.]